MINQITDTPVLKDFVSPLLCEDLMYAGFALHATFSWKIYHDQVMLHTLAFDIDDYYKDGCAALDKITPPKKILPAFTIKEIEPHLPDYCTCRVNKMYEMSLDKNYYIEPIKAERLPDLFAFMMLMCIRKKVINPSKIFSL